MGNVVHLIDADILVYRSGFAAEKMKYCVHIGENATVHLNSHKEAVAYAREIPGAEITKERFVEPVENALHNVNSLMDKIVGSINEVYLTGKGNFRYDRATLKKYKGNRDKQAKPVHYDAIRSHLIHRWGAIVVDGMEADDMLGIRSTELAAQGDEPVIVSIDKDLLMIEGWHYDFVKDEKVYVSKLEAWRNFYKQCLTGDSTDNIPGIYGTGPIGASRLLEQCNSPGEMREIVAKAWEEAYPNGFERYDGSRCDAREAFKEVAELLWIRRERVLPSGVEENK